jgi:hypothetical protein
MTAHDEVTTKIRAMSSEDVRRWLNDRLRNCHRMAVRKTGEDRDGWLSGCRIFCRRYRSD